MQSTKMAGKIYRRASVKRNNKKEQLSILKSSSNEIVKKVKPTTFKPGNKAGKGRPHGARTNGQVALEEIGQDAAENAYRVIVTAALTGETKGDVGACKYIVDRCSPVRKGARVKLDLPKIINTVDDLNEATESVMQMMASGKISLEEATLICGVIEFRSKTIELRDGIGQLTELRKELDEIKQRGL